jgi:hypothetical protein
MIAQRPLIQWTPDSGFWSAEQAEHAVVGKYELVALILSRHPNSRHVTLAGNCSAHRGGGHGLPPAHVRPSEEPKPLRSALLRRAWT